MNPDRLSAVGHVARTMVNVVGAVCLVSIVVLLGAGFYDAMSAATRAQADRSLRHAYSTVWLIVEVWAMLAVILGATMLANGIAPNGLGGGREGSDDR